MEMTGDKEELHCYNRGCGQKYSLANNDNDVCRHHPGLPFFHDAYKGWSCCNKKCTDFTEFLNIKGCALGKHSNEKPPELPKSTVDPETTNEVVKVSPVPKTESSLLRPSFDSPMIILEPIIPETVVSKFTDCPHKDTTHQSYRSDVVVVGTVCKNGGCRGSYEGPESDTAKCILHPGTPVFHEGMKYWSCCQKKTSDFNAFLNQAGCTTGVHKWRKEAQPLNTVKCRWDWHQTASFVVVAIYSKDYHPLKSFVKINPIRLLAVLEFPQSNDAKFDLDLELRGIVDVKNSSVHMLGTKVEIKLRKAEPGSWPKLDFPRIKEESKEESVGQPQCAHDDKNYEDGVDLDDVEPISQMKIREVV